MCGIVGYSGSRPVIDILLRGLKRLEYRGYDSAGIAFFEGPKIEILKSEGKLENLEKLAKNEMSQSGLMSTCGIGHTRWATHGKPTTENAHPHKTGHVVLVHNGIIENYLDIKKDLTSRGHRPCSETDSELFGFLVLEEMETGTDLATAVRKCFGKIEGSCSVVVMSEREPGVIVGARRGSPLIAALDPNGGVAVASDAQPLLEFTRDVYFLEHGDLVVGSGGKISFFDLKTGQPLQRNQSTVDWSVESLDKRGLPHYMLKEIFEQPNALVDTLNGLLNRTTSAPFTFADQPGVELIESADEITIVACGTSWHAALLGKYWIELLASVRVDVELASEFRYREPVLSGNALVIGLSQSGETADTLAVIHKVRKQGVPTLGITNVRGSTLTREANASFFTCAGPEVGVAATKTFTAQMLTLFLIAGYLCARKSRLPSKEITRIFEELVRLPHLLLECLVPQSELNQAILTAAQKEVNAKGFFFIGRGYSFPIALEGALKLKEIAYVHAEGYAAGELKHGPIAMIDKGMVVVVLVPKDSWRDKTVSNLEEVKARGATIVGIGDPSDRALQGLCDHWVPLPESARGLDPVLLPFLLTPAIQLLSYRLAVLKGTDVDKPRNLAKSVTVE